MTFRFLIASLVFGLMSFVAASENSAAGRAIQLVAQVPYKNPGVVTLGTLVIESRIDFSINVISSNGNKLTISWDWGDGTPPGSGAQPNHTYIVAGSYTVTVTVTEAGNPKPGIFTLPVTVTDAVKSAKLQTNEVWNRKNADSISLTGVLHVPANQPLAGKIVDCDIGGVLLNFKLDARGSATLTTNMNNITSSSGTFQSSNSCKASFKIFVRKRPANAGFEDSQFKLLYKKGSIQDALAFPALVTNRTAIRDNVRITFKITYDANNPENAGILFQSSINSLFTSKANQRGATR